MKSELELHLLYAALNTMGIYPQSTVDAFGKKTQRNEWQEGWNKAIISFTKNWRILCKWIDTIPEPTSRLLRSLIHEDVIEFSIDKKDEKYEVTMWVNVNDTFSYACGDVEDVGLDDILFIHSAYNNYKYDGIVAWVARKRGIAPIEPRNTVAYRRAFRYLEKLESVKKFKEGGGEKNETDRSPEADQGSQKEG